MTDRSSDGHKLGRCIDCDGSTARTRNERCMQCASKNRTGDKSSAWKGDKVGYQGLHVWVRRHLPKPRLCQDCETVPPYELANISQEYKRDLNDWEWVCRKCHMEKDGRLERTRRGEFAPLMARDSKGRFSSKL